MRWTLIRLFMLILLMIRLKDFILKSWTTAVLDFLLLQTYIEDFKLKEIAVVIPAKVNAVEKVIILLLKLWKDLTTKWYFGLGELSL